MRLRVGQQRIEHFLQRLGRQFNKPGRVYLLGGTTMVYEGLRQQTLDIHLALEIADEDHFEVILMALMSSHENEGGLKRLSTDA